jgi:hypothetical protein
VSSSESNPIPSRIPVGTGRPGTVGNDEGPWRLPSSHASVSGAVLPSETKTNWSMRFDAGPAGMAMRHNSLPFDFLRKAGCEFQSMRPVDTYG